MAITEGEQKIIDELKKIKKLIKGTYIIPEQADAEINKPDV